MNEQKDTDTFLKDQHNHLSFYSALSRCMSLQGVTVKENALAQLRHLDKENISVILGWNGGYYSFEEELRPFAPGNHRECVYFTPY
ncbi:MAG: hypothetical protein MZV70_42015 [Desulfobacterales bacterium]|nr:hypothetical protein [Desulfobacterales bacterium]